MQKVLFILNSLKRRGAEQQVFNFVASIGEIVKIDVFTFSKQKDDFPDFFNLKNVNVFLSKYSGTYNALKFWELCRYVKRGRYEGVVTLGLGAALFWGRLSAYLNRIPLIYSQLNTYENFNNLPRIGNEYFDILNKLLNARFYKGGKSNFYCFLPNSKILSKKISKELNGYPVRTLYNGFLQEEFQSMHTYEPPDRVKLIANFIENRDTILQVGALDKTKNPMFILKSLPRILQDIKDAHLLFIGEGDEKNALQQWIKKNKLIHKVSFVGQLKRMDCLYLMKLVGVLVLASESESFPNVLVEAQALGNPVVSLDVGAASEIVEHGKTGYIVSERNQHDFTKYILRILKNDDVAGNMGTMAQEKIFLKYSMDIKINRFLNMIYNDLQSIRINRASI